MGTWYVLRPDRGPASVRRLTGAGPGKAVLAAVFISLFSVALSALQHSFYPYPTAVDRHMPSTLSGYTAQASTAQGDGYLLTVGVPAVASGQTITVKFSPPGWTLELVTFGLGVGAGLLWIVIATVRRRRASSAV